MNRQTRLGARVLAAGAVLGWAVAAGAQLGRPPDALSELYPITDARPVRYDAAEFKRGRLRFLQVRFENGLTMLIHKRADGGVNTLRVVARAGGANDPPAGQGLNRMLAHAVAAASVPLGGSTLGEVLNARGTLLRAYPGALRTEFELIAARDHFVRDAALFVSLLGAPFLGPDTLGQIFYGLRNQGPYFDRLPEEGMPYLGGLFPGLVREKDIYGMRGTSSPPLSDETMRYFTEGYAPENVVIVAVGDFDEAALIDFTAKYGPVHRKNPTKSYRPLEWAKNKPSTPIQQNFQDPERAVTAGLVAGWDNGRNSATAETAAGALALLAEAQFCRREPQAAWALPLFYEVPGAVIFGVKLVAFKGSQDEFSDWLIDRAGKENRKAALKLVGEAQRRIAARWSAVDVENRAYAAFLAEQANLYPNVGDMPDHHARLKAAGPDAVGALLNRAAKRDRHFVFRTAP